MENNSSVLLLDVMGTLVHEPFYREIPGYFGMGLRDLLAIKHPTSWIEFENGKIDEKSFLEQFFADGRSFDHEGFKGCIRDAYRFLDGMEELLGDLQSAGVEAHLLSNYPVWHRMIEERLGLRRFVDGAFFSCDMQCRKPDAAAYQYVAHALQRDPDAFVLVDDRPENCEGAERVGMQAIHFVGAEPLRAELASRGILHSDAAAGS